jgi:hypothetical protein
MIVLCTIVYSAIDQIVRIFKTRTLAKFTRQHGVSDASLVAAVERAMRGLIDADLGGHIIKQRVHGRAGEKEAASGC